MTKSEKFTQEYCCTVVRVGELKPIDGADKIAQTIVNGESIVVRKDQVKEGDILLYASNETQLNEGFLSANNLFDVDCYEKNSNASEVTEMATRRESLKINVDATSKMISKVKKSIAKKHAKSLSEFIKRYDKHFSTDSIESLCEKAEEIIKEENERISKAKSEIDEIKAFMRSKCGFFNKYGRVKLIRLKGIPSFGYLFTLQELGNWMNEHVMDLNLEEHVGEDFDTVCGELFVKAYVPPIKDNKTKVDRSNDDKRSRKAEKRFDRLVEGQFKFHYDTNPLARNMHLLNPNTVVTISDKLHGTSLIVANVKVKTPIRLPFHKWLWNLICNNRLLEKYMVKNYIEEYGPIYSSRKVIKNKYINKGSNEGFYGQDIWTEYGELMYKYLPKGMTIYGEIVGYLSGSDKMIQKDYDYGCDVGANKMMIYRITTQEDDGKLREWNVDEVHKFTLSLIDEHDELRDRLLPIEILYHGTLGDAYPNVKKEVHWNENVLEEMKNDSVRLGMELMEPSCMNIVPREGVVLRIDDDVVQEAFKLKCQSFLFKEQELMDNEEVDIEMQENNEEV